MKEETKRIVKALDEELHVPRSLFIFLDGTSNEFNADESNALKIYQLLEKDKQQLCYYQTGIGTVSASSSYLPPSVVESKASMALGSSVDYHVQLAYTWLCEKYRPGFNGGPGDKLFIFGFSRGAYAARIGVLDAGCTTLVPKAYAAYTTVNMKPEERKDFGGLNTFVPAANSEDAKRFRRSAVKIKEIHFLGLWDTVQSVHMSKTPVLPGTASLFGVTHIAHAVALDEDRALFAISKVEPTSTDEINHEYHLKSGAWALSLRPELHELCFAGVHADVGGGEHTVGKPVTLFTTQFFKQLEYRPNPAFIPLRWMLYQAGSRGARLSWENTVGGFRDELRTWLLEVPAPCYLHLLPLLRELRSGGMAYEKRLEFAMETGALLDSVSPDMLRDIAKNGRSQGIKKAAQGVLADLNCNLKPALPYSTSKTYSALAGDWKQFNPLWSSPSIGVRSFTVNTDTSPSEAKRSLRIHPSVSSRIKVWSTRPKGQQYQPKAHLFDESDPPAKIEHVEHLEPAAYQNLKDNKATLTPDQKIVEVLKGLVLGEIEYEDGWDKEKWVEHDENDPKRTHLFDESDPPAKIEHVEHLEPAAYQDLKDNKATLTPDQKIVEVLKGLVLGEIEYEEGWDKEKWVEHDEK